MNEAASTAATNNVQVVRETIESLAVAFILALLFKAFIAEAFVIPTGSMAPTLMGAHKDICCEECGYQYQGGASEEFNDVGWKKDLSVVATTCPLCRKPQIANPYVNSNQATFSGDRILVSKLAYVFSKPRRWDVIVFKYPHDARLNYIKRCVGKPDETIRIHAGNVHIQENSSETNKTTSASKGFEIARKPPHVVNAMLQMLYDSNYVPKSLVKAGMPSSWQPFPVSESKWDVKQTETQWSASIRSVPSGTTQWLRYYHRVYDPIVWESITSKGAFPSEKAASTYRLISDFTAYNARYCVTTSKINKENFQESAENAIQEITVNGFRKHYVKVRDEYQRTREQWLENDGIHWTGDLAADFEFKTDKETQAFSMVLVEAGVEHVCRIDLKSGLATAQVLMDGEPVNAFEKGDRTLAKQATAETPIRAGGRHRIRFANVDDGLFLWIDGKPMLWNPSGNLMSESYLPLDQRTPRSTASNPLDAAPIAVGIEGGSGEIFRAQVLRDIYYIAQSGGQSLYDYPDIQNTFAQSSNSENDQRYAGEIHSMSRDELSKKMSEDGIRRNALLTNPELWANSPMGTKRKTLDFKMKSGQYFPMGDNSAASADARSWGHTPQRLMIGRAVMVFWPHYWNAPIPFVPNVQRMGLIR